MDTPPTSKSAMMRDHFHAGRMKKALAIAKTFRIGLSKEERETIIRAYECMVWPEQYRALEIDVTEAVEKGISSLSKMCEQRTDSMLEQTRT